MAGAAHLSPAARRYGRALLAAAVERGAVAEVAGSMRLLAAALADDGIAGWLADPSVDGSRKRQVLAKSFEGRLQPLVASLLEVLARRRRHALLPELPAAFRAELDRHEGRLRGLVESARELPEDELQGLEQTLGQRTGKVVRLDQRVEAGLLGGLRITLDGVRYDGSARGRLERMRRQLLQADLGT